MDSHSNRARLAGALFVLSTLTGIVRLMYIPKVLFAGNDAAATAANIAAHVMLFRVGIVSSLVSATIWAFVPLALYKLLSEVDRRLALLMVLFGTVFQVPILLITAATDGPTLLLATGANSLSAFSAAQRAAGVDFFIDLHHHLDLANAIFWGLWLVPFGLLVYRSRMIPRVFGVWLIVACLAWLAFSFTGFLFPLYEGKVFRLTQPLALGEMATMLWLLIVGAKDAAIVTSARLNDC